MAEMRGHRTWRRWLAPGIALMVCLVIGAAVGVALRWSSDGGSAASAEPGLGHSCTPTKVRDAASAPPSRHLHDADMVGGLGVQKWTPPSGATAQATLDRQLARARAAALRYSTPAAANAAGYQQSSDVEPGSGTHYTDWDLVNCHFRAARPSQLIFDRVGPDAKLIALSYFVVSPPGKPPKGFAGSNDVWHQHWGLCVQDGVLKGRLGGREGVRACRAQHGTLLDGRDIWMLHAWVVAGQENPWGVFAAAREDRLRPPPGS